MDIDKLASFIRDENEQTRHCFDVVAEGLKSDIRLIAEGHGALVEKMDRMESKVDILDSRMDRLETKVDCLETKVDGLEAKVDILDSRMGRLETKVDGLETKVDILDSRMDHLKTQVETFAVETRTNFEEMRASIKFSYAELDRRLTFLESGFKDLSSRMVALENRRSQ